jgi:beta-fructofuranosidase
LGQEPIPELTKLRCSAKEVNFASRELTSSGYQKVYVAKSTHYELRVSISLTKTSIAGLTLRKSSTGCEQTDIYIDVTNEVIVVDRSISSQYSQFNNLTEEGKFRLWSVDGKLQPLDLHIFVDNSIIEIFANGVFCLTTRIYPSSNDANEVGYLVKEGSASYGELVIWDGLDNVWPERPENSSVPLVFDDASITQNGTLWPGN